MPDLMLACPYMHHFILATSLFICLLCQSCTSQHVADLQQCSNLELLFHEAEFLDWPSENFKIKVDGS